MTPRIPGVHAPVLTVKMYTMCLIKDGDRVLLIKRPEERGFPGYIAPGGKIEFPESLTEGAAREVLEETGLTVKNLLYKGLDEFADPAENFRYMVFNYLASDFEGDLLTAPPEGSLHWIPIADALSLPMQPWFRRRFPLFFEEGTFEIFAVYDQKSGQTIRETVKKL